MITLNYNPSFAENIINDIIRKQSKIINDVLEKDTRENSLPPIKGAITKGKLKWRGLSLIQKRTDRGIEKWIEQRGKRISRVVLMQATFTPTI
jgi:hypothetical protein